MRGSAEAGIVGAFRSRLGCRGPPEDVDPMVLGGAAASIAIDTLVWGTDVPPGMTPRMAARKSAVACVSDFAAKGVRPAAGVVSAVLPRGTTRAGAAGLAAGLADAAGEFGFGFVGGDTNEGKELCLSVCLVGASPPAVPRGGARPGDLVFATGPFGYTAAGLEIMLRGAAATARFAARARRAVCRPAARLGFGVAAARHMTASMDTSDGLSSALHGIASQSGAGIEVGRLPAGPGVGRFAARNGLSAERLVLDGGEEFEIAFAAPPGRRRAVMAAAARAGAPAAEIGRVVRGSGVSLSGAPVPDGGWRHLRGRRRPRKAAGANVF